MLSIETPPGPSCPCKASLLRTDDRAPDQLPSEEADPVGLCENQTPNFSIRDYVFTSRSKDITVNWPFPRQFLQLCLKHGVRYSLPPFELPDSVRERFCRKVTESDQSVACSGAQKISSQFESPDIKDAGPVNEELCNLISESCLQSDELVSCSDRAARHPLIEKQSFDHGEISDAEPSQDDAETVSLLSNQDQIERISDQSSELHCSIQVTRSVSETASEVEVAQRYPLPSKLENLRDPLEKKCRLIVKFGAITETSRTEDVVSTCSTVSDPMASKVCPVCKLFASTSNTTLNAHIDQCLSADSNIRQVATQIPNKVKTTKKRLMVDIYATAPYCTLEELDKRNGTNWASEVTLMAPTNEACSEVKRPKMPPVDIREDEKQVDIRDDGNKGAVYVDSNGIKLRILSKFNDTPPMTSREHFKLKKHAKPIKEGKSLLLCKKKRFGSKYSKYMKVKQPNKKRSSSKLFKSETRAIPEEDHHADTNLEKEESPSEILNTPDQTKSSASTTLRHWVCSKRSNLPKKHNHKDINNLKNSLLKTKNILTESNQLDVCYPSIVENHALKVSRPSEDSRSRSKTKIVDFLSNNVQIMDNGKKSPKQPVFNSKCSSESASKNGLILKISRSLGTSIYSPRIRKEDIQMSTIQKSDNSPDTMETSGSCHSSMKAKKSLSAKKNVLFERQHSSEGSKGDVGNKLSISKKFRKYRSILVTGKKGEPPSDINGKLCRSIKHVGIDAARISKTLRSHRPDLSEGIHRSVTKDIMDQESPTTTNTSESAEDASTMRKQKYSTLKCLNSNIECHDAELVTFDRQVTACVDNAKSSLEIAVGDPVGTEPIISENLTPDSNAKSDPRPSEVGNVQSVCGSEARVEPLAEKMCDDQAIQSCNINGTCDEVISQSIQVADEVGSRRELEIYAAQETECLVETISVQGSTACLTCHGDGAFEIPQENSSITSHRITSDPDHHLAVDREPTGSPISTASTISPPSPKDSVSVHDQSGLGVPCVTDIDVIKPRNLERRNQEAKVFPLAKEPEQFSEDQPCCCLRREGLSRESQFLRHGVMAVTMPPSKGKQISNLSITESMSSSFSSYLGLRTDVMATPILESPTGSIITKASVDCSGKAPTYIDFSSPSPSPRTQTQSNSILRLMGKNLMVANKEESAQLPMVYHSATDIPSNAHCLPPGFATTCYEGFSYHQHQFPCGSTFFGEDPTVASHQIPQYSSNMRVGSFAGSLQAGMKMKPDQQILHKLNKKPNSLSACNMERTVASHQHHERTVSSSQANMVKEVIVIDDSPDFEHELKCNMPNPAGILPAIPGSNPMQQRPVSYVPSQSHFFPRNVTSGGFIPHPNAWPRGYDFANTMNQGKASEGSDPIPPRPFMFQPHSTGRQHALFGTKHYPAMAAKHSAPEIMTFVGILMPLGGRVRILHKNMQTARNDL